MISLIMAAVAPGLALLSFFYLKEQFDSEPIYMVGRMFVFGVILVFPIMVLQYTFQEALVLSSFYQAFVLSALLEEFFKWFILLFVAYHQVEFNQHYDGIVYGVSVSMGFATMENVMYLWIHGIDHAVMRALLPVSSHALFGVVMGYYLGKAKFITHQRTYRKLMIYSLVIPVFLHGTYNFILYLGHHWWQWFMLLFMITLWWYSLRKVKKANANIIPLSESSSKNQDLGAY